MNTEVRYPHQQEIRALLLSGSLQTCITIKTLLESGRSKTDVLLIVESIIANLEKELTDSKSIIVKKLFDILEKYED